MHPTLTPIQLIFLSPSNKLSLSVVLVGASSQLFDKPMFNLIQSDSIRHAESANPFDRARSEALEVEMLTMASQINAAQYRFFTLLFELDEHGGWQGDDIRSFAYLLSWKIGMGVMMGP